LANVDEFSPVFLQIVLDVVCEMWMGAMKMMVEADVRTWLAARVAEAAGGVRLVWHEPPRNGHGATTGHPDASLTWLDGTRVAVELKCWDRLLTGQFAARIRREQIRYHYRANLAGDRTVLVWGELGESRVWAIHGSRAPKTVSSRINERETSLYAPVASVRPHACSGTLTRAYSDFLIDVKLNLIP